MRWSVISYYQPFLNPKRRLALAAGFVLIAAARCLFDFLEKGLTGSFYLYGGFALVAIILEGKHYNKPRQISLLLEDGKLVYKNHYTGELHTVYQSRVHWIKYEEDAIIFYGESSIATTIPVLNFPREKVSELRELMKSWNKKIVEDGSK
ncbi:MAG: hypothetical protein MUE99_11270 [Chitinophagaceae bacterium]|nr:hypothetical protein [Chitinophagaceae bacterium]